MERFLWAWKDTPLYVNASKRNDLPNVVILFNDKSTGIGQAFASAAGCPSVVDVPGRTLRTSRMMAAIGILWAGDQAAAQRFERFCSENGGRREVIKPGMFGCKAVISPGVVVE